ncbi:MAG: BON domain-containing protein [Burkholderiales bacterium]|jgi:osmotically-inducible protein OsmY|nr:BON domain-containing protein [Burkholderiales bacterium]
MRELRLAVVAVVLAATTLLGGCAAAVIGGAAAGGAMVATDRRLSDVIAADERIEWTVLNRLNDRFKDQIHVNVTSFNRNVLLTGEAATDSVKQEAERLAAGVAEVRSVTNELAVGPASSLTSRSNDSYITSQVKARLVGAEGVNPLHVKVVTEAGVVYLMGLLTQKEADVATRVARQTSGVRKVVQVFEIIPGAKPVPVESKPVETKQ